MTFLYLLSLDIIRSFRKEMKSLRRSPIISAWFLVLIVVGESFLLLAYRYSGDVVGGNVSAGRTLILLTLFFTVKTSYHFRREVLQEGPFQTMYTTPVGFPLLKWEKTVYIGILNYLLLLLFLVPFTTLSLLLSITFNVSLEAMLLAVLLPILSTVAGSTLASSRYLLENRKTIPLYSLLSIPVAFQIYLLEWWGPQISLLLFFPLLALQVLLFALFFRPWGGVGAKHQRSVAKYSPLSLRWEKGVEVGMIGGMFWAIRRRRHDVGGSILTFLFIAAAEVYLSLHHPGERLISGSPASTWILRVSPPATASFFIFLSASLEALLPSMMFLGEDYRRLWMFRTTPARSLTDIRGKMRATLLLTPLSIPFAALPMAILNQFPIPLMALLLEHTLLAIFLSATLGLLGSVKYREEVSEGKGYPPVVPLYSTLMINLIVYGGAVGISAAAYVVNEVLGVAVGGFLTALAYFSYKRTLIWTARRLEEIEL